jgi:polyisoprenoid-binding protein YceI
MPRLLIALILLRVFALGVASAADSGVLRSIDSEKSVMTVRVFKAGLFSGFAHDHEISAPIQEGSFDQANPSVQLKVDARKLRVVDKDVSDKDCGEIQQTMLGPKVLDSERFPEIRFRSTRVEHITDRKWLVHGELNLHGQTRPVSVDVAEQNGHYRGTAELKQKDFGIIPISLGGGTIKVKNELRVQFDIVGR